MSVWEASEGAGAEAEGKQLEAVFTELMQECRHSAPGARLSARLRTQLERMAPGARRAVCARTREGCAPLFVAARRGNVEIVQYLVSVCGADVEQRGRYEVPDDRSVHLVTPLWCAAVAGRLDAVRALHAAGAALDARSDTGSTPVRSACFMTHVDVVRYLVRHGADIRRPNYNGGTCLINSVQSAALCALLLAHGAPVDARDNQDKTALHYAVQEHRLDTARLLLEHGADPALRSRHGDDALTTAALKGASHIFSLLLQRHPYSAERRADATELLGSTLLDEFNDVSLALAQWRAATALRHSGPVYLDKRPHVAAAEALDDAREWRTLAELDALATDVEALRVQALLVCARVLGPHHKDTVFRLMYRGAHYVEARRYARTAALWQHALTLRLARNSLLCADTCAALQALCRLLLDAHAQRLGSRELPPRRAPARLLRLLAEHLPAALQQLRQRPVYRKHSEMLDRALKCATHLLYLALDAAAGPRELAEAQALARGLVVLDARSALTGDTLLHLAASRLNVVRSSYFTGEERAPPVFPSLPVTRALLAAGADPATANDSRSTPLHVAAIPYNFSTELVEALLAGGAHVDAPNKFGDVPATLIANNRESRVRVLRHVTLACLAARALLSSRAPLPPAPTHLPPALRAFVLQHQP